MRDGDVAGVGLRPAQPEPLAALTEEPSDVGRQVAEEVARIGVLGHAARGQARLEAVDRPAAVGVDQAAHEGPRIALDDLALPRREDDRALVLATRPHLGKRSGQSLDDALTFTRCSMRSHLILGSTTRSERIIAPAQSSMISGYAPARVTRSWKLHRVS